MTRLKVVLLSLLCCMVTLTVTAQQQKFTGSFKDAKLSSVLETVQRKTGVTFVYNEALVKGAPKVTINANDETVSSFMQRLLLPRKMEVVWQGNTGVIRRQLSTRKAIDVYGRVVDENDDPLVGVTVTNTNGQQSTVTSTDGSFGIRVNEQDVLRFSYIGMKPQVVVCDRREINIIMKDDVTIAADVNCMKTFFKLCCIKIVRPEFFTLGTNRMFFITVKNQINIFNGIIINTGTNDIQVTYDAHILMRVCNTADRKVGVRVYIKVKRPLKRFITAKVDCLNHNVIFSRLSCT